MIKFSKEKVLLLHKLLINRRAARTASAISHF